MASSPKTAAESLIPLFQFRQLLNQDQNGRRISLLGEIHSQPALLILERAAFPNDPSILKTLLAGISNTTNLGANDIYRWYMASSSSSSSPSSPSSHDPSSSSSGASERIDVKKSQEGVVPPPLPPPDLKLNLIYPCTPSHIKKYSPQPVRMVTETPSIYARHIHPYMRRKREEGRLNWVFNIIEGRTEQEDVILREHSTQTTTEAEVEAKVEAKGADRSLKGQGGAGENEGFLLLPDLNWDRETIGSLHLLALVERRDIWSLRDLRKKHVRWLKRLRENVLSATVGVYGGRGVERDMLKLYVHYQPTYYHFHIHIVNVMLEAGTTQATGKAFGLENLIAQLESMEGGEEAGMADVSLTYFLGEASELWEGLFGPLKEGREPAALGSES